MGEQQRRNDEDAEQLRKRYHSLKKVSQKRNARSFVNVGTQTDTVGENDETVSIECACVCICVCMCVCVDQPKR